MNDLLSPLSDEELADARRRIAGRCLRTPLIAGSDGVHLKLEALQPHGSYKIRGATNALQARLEQGLDFTCVTSASAGNFGQALAAAAKRTGLPVTIHVPDNAARVKLAALERLGATVVEHPHADWWRIMQTRQTGDDGALFLHPVCEREVIAGAATIGLELIEDTAPADVVLVPFGGGGLITGIAEVVKRHWPSCRVLAVEAETAAPLTAAFKAGAPVVVERRPSFIDGMGSSRVLDEMWPRLRRLVDDTVVVSLAEIAEAIRTIARDQHVIAEGAGAAAVAAAARFPRRSVVAIISGGNIDPPVLSTILAGATPD